MQELKRIVGVIQNSDNYRENALILSVLISAYKSEKKKMTAEHLATIKSFVLNEAKRLITAIPAADNYRLKDEMLSYGTYILEFYGMAVSGQEESDEDKQTILNLFDLAKSERVVENSVDSLFKLKSIDQTAVKCVIDRVEGIADEYQRCGFFNCMLQNSENFSLLTESAKGEISAFFVRELERLNKIELSVDETGTLELIADVGKYFITEEFCLKLQNALQTADNGVRFFAIETLLSSGRDVSHNIVSEVAHDLRYAYMLFCLVAELKSTYLFPTELISDEYIAKSEMVQWLVYPTELGKAPDELELIGCTDVENETYYVFKYKSDSDNLAELKNEWLIGWSSGEGGAFSNFDKLCDYEKDTPEKTLENIAKKLLK